MSPAEWADERRDALSAQTELQRVAACGHRRLNRNGDCADCDARAEEIQ